MRTALIALVVLAAATPAAAQLSPQATISVLDTNGDGAVDLAEYLAFRRAAFDDEDGVPGASRTEFRASLEPAAQRTADAAFTQFDANRDNILDAAEADAYHSYVFRNVLDRDHDGRWTLAELQALTAAPTAAPTGPPTPEAAIAALDADGNGSVSAIEYLRFQVGRFPQIDADHDGFLSQAEFRAGTPGSRANVPTTFRTFDVDHDNRFSQAEFTNLHSYVFDTVLDRNHDGAWTAEEYRAYQRSGR
jgi:Ca2+-binding EF-hand superfamily protein